VRRVQSETRLPSLLGLSPQSRLRVSSPREDRKTETK
jgi:hypothetical protein